MVNECPVKVVKNGNERPGKVNRCSVKKGKVEEET